MFRTPREFNLEITDISENFEGVDLLMLQLSHTRCRVNICGPEYSTETGGYIPASDSLLRRLSRKNVKYSIGMFCGGLESVKNLPKSTTTVFLTIICDKNNVGHDPGLQYLEETLPHLTGLLVKMGGYLNWEKLYNQIIWDTIICKIRF